MANLTFADTYNMVAFLSKSDASTGFDQIVDFLNTQDIQYALMVNPAIYVSCIKQFWATVSIKNVNDVVKLRALIDGKRVVVTEDVIRQDIRLDDADGVECLPNEEIFTKLARMGYEKSSPKLMFYKAFFSAQWKFLIHTLVQCVSAKRTVWNEFRCSMASAVICLATGRKFNFSKYIFDSMVRNVDSPSKFLIVGKGFFGVETPLFATMLVQPQPPVAQLEQDKTAQALEIFKLKKRVKKLEKKMRSKSSDLKRGRTKAIDADEDITLVDAKTQVDLGAELQRRKDDDKAAIKDVSAIEPTVFNDEEVTMTMAQTLIKMKAEKARLLDEQMAKRIHDEKVKQAAAKEKHEKDESEKAKVLQQQKNMIIYLKNMVEYKMENFRGMTYEKESFKKLKVVEVSGSESTQDTPTSDLKEMSEEDVKNMLQIVPVTEFKVEALQLNVKFQVEEDSEMAKDLVMKIFTEANKPKSKSKIDTAAEITEEITLSS
nr:hypothetical protein [Tanacetum cinerariifolium]